MAYYSSPAERYRIPMRPEDLTPPPPIDASRIEFSDDFHPLFHRFGDRECRSLQPWPRAHYLHIAVLWNYGPTMTTIRGVAHRCTT